jgi:hypothetical protein
MPEFPIKKHCSMKGLANPKIESEIISFVEVSR